MTGAARPLALLLGAVLLAAAGAARAAPAGATREEALAALADPGNVEARRRGAQALGATGTMADAPALVRALRDRDEVVRALAERAMWELWSRSGDADVDRLLQIGIEQMNARAGEAAAETFTKVVERRPDFAEGWNKRATIWYLLGEYTKSLADCDEVMKRNPYHFGALSGYGMIYLQLGQPALALTYFEKALDVNPNLGQVRETAEALRQLLIQRGRGTI
ncbi:MAG: hypothetical protein A3E31_16210 [Candidatus Rokubacteria bacterium RIFCSPHIGHO2_12_FULL_73_22]|nr:MAG: hypothetical protein A3E31_16210 [Candidatus Rokubacteria bacterium RIFCSPHIGHO2_12_FULL_73_22]OGL02528.1 MAG: hypothetical protein A3D33_10475 [Candidatus Rokubacteria bacterium RIFCSPHIGHO2_02_FULL_73_26]OGL08618.1 MAG: hypothetical protein A3I14_17665 [Candidatus Rokubacteria bacterium RIFCSPLOWO2_02_FULL_73_56]OGL27742.1 MAG: hypothetical protein A3G44_03835 [Candidatus Rokubacteria bacterium RIFCSPLOWO2_12_FULL_73_47]